MKERTKNIIGFSLFFILIISFIAVRIILQNDLKANGIIVKAKIIQVATGGKGSGGFICSLSYDNETKETSTPTTLKKGRYDMIGHTFPGMYSPKTGILEVLMTPTDFEKFNIPFPDSLKWVIKYTIDN